jgi:hypothetical protein
MHGVFLSPVHECVVPSGALSILSGRGNFKFASAVLGSLSKHSPLRQKWHFRWRHSWMRVSHTLVVQSGYHRSACVPHVWFPLFVFEIEQ